MTFKYEDINQYLHWKNLGTFLFGILHPALR